MCVCVYLYICVYLCIVGKHPFINRPTVLRDTYFNLLHSYSNYMFFVFLVCVYQGPIYVSVHPSRSWRKAVPSIWAQAIGCCRWGAKPRASWFRISHWSPTRKKKHENIMVSRRAHIKYQRWSFNQSLIWFYCRGIDEIVMGKDNYINYIVLMGLTFGNQTWLAGKSSSMEAFCGKFNGKTRGFSGSPCGKKGTNSCSYNQAGLCLSMICCL